MQIRSWNMNQFDEATLDLIPDRVTVNLNMFGALVQDRVGGDMDLL